MRWTVGLLTIALLVTGCGGDQSQPVSESTPTWVAGSAGNGDDDPTTTTVSTQQDQGGTMDVTIPSEGLTLEGTLTLPDRDGPFPGVVIIHGSGPVDRNGTVPGQLNTGFPAPVSVYRDLADGLAERGIASLRYDKRTCGTFNACSENAYPVPGDDLLLDAFLADALAALDWLAARDEIGVVNVIGHSQGSTLAILAAERRPDLANIVLVGAPYRTVDLVTRQQATDSRVLAAELGMSQEQIDAAVAVLEQMANDVQALRLGAYAGGPIAGVSVAFWKSWLNAGERAQELAKAMEHGLLIIGGGADTAVEFGAWREALAGSDNELVWLDCITHALNCMDGTDIGSHVAPEVIDTIAEAVAGAS